VLGDGVRYCLTLTAIFGIPLRSPALFLVAPKADDVHEASKIPLVDAIQPLISSNKSRSYFYRARRLL
jgi:hypothetical protein